MFSIKKSFVDCTQCSLYNCPSCILESNCIDNLSKVEVVFVAENPGKDEVNLKRPLIGRAGQVFRKPFRKYFSKYFNYLLTNIILCLTLNPDGTTGNPNWKTTSFCRNNCFNFIKLCSPELIVAMGSTAMRAFDVGDSGILSKRGRLYRWSDYDLFLTVHPSYVLRTGSVDAFYQDFQSAKQILIDKLCKKGKIKVEEKTFYANVLKSTFKVRRFASNEL